jgi:hypothetical protein
MRKKYKMQYLQIVITGFFLKKNSFEFFNSFIKISNEVFSCSIIFCHETTATLEYSTSVVLSCTTTQLSQSQHPILSTFSTLHPSGASPATTSCRASPSPSRACAQTTSTCSTCTSGTTGPDQRDAAGADRFGQAREGQVHRGVELQRMAGT